MSFDDKEFLTLCEAAEFCGVSYRNFIKERANYGIPAIQFMGKQLYRKSDLVRAIEQLAPTVNHSDS
jgi:hypothetical protein